MALPTKEEVKSNLILSGNADDDLITSYISAAVSYAEGYQHLEDGYYAVNEMPARTKQAVIMLASHYYESRDGGVGGFFSQNADAARQAKIAVDNLLILDREWKV